jgi:hypothetical protein
MELLETSKVAKLMEIPPQLKTLQLADSRSPKVRLRSQATS